MNPAVDQNLCATFVLALCFFLAPDISLADDGALSRPVAEDQPLVALHEMLVPLRPAAEPGDSKQSYAGIDSESRGATPALMAVKHTLRDWIESRLTAMSEADDENTVQRQINDELQRADLFCESASKPSQNRCEYDFGWSSIGFLEPIRLKREQYGKILVVHTGIGILCGSDDSAYAYEWRNNTWRRFWSSEQEIQPGKPYTPQYIHAVHVSHPNEETQDRLVLSLGNQRWCSSNFYNVYFRLWRTNPDGREPEILLDKTQSAYLGAHDPPIMGSVGSQDALIEFRVTSLDIGVHSYETVRHYKLDGNKIVRVDPIALNPRNFTEEWLTADWTESAGWVAANHIASVESWHKKFHASYISGEYINDTQHCKKHSDLWQVGIAFGDIEKPKDKAYFLVRWRPPYHFEMVDVSRTPRAECKEPDESADGEHTLFPIQEWRE